MTMSSMLLLSIVSALAGSMLFFAATVAPTVFRTLSPTDAGAFLRSFFPLYYLWGLALAVAAALLAAIVDVYALAACVLVAAMFGYARQILMPNINKARDDQAAAVSGAGKRFRALHFRSVVINGVQLLLLAAVAAYLLWLPIPTP